VVAAPVVVVVAEDDDPQALRTPASAVGVPVTAAMA